jgi:hypothetical protein
MDEQFGDQGLISKRAWKLNYPLVDLGTNFNFVGSMINRAGGVRHVTEPVNVFHLTSFLPWKQRMYEAQELDQIWEAR